MAFGVNPKGVADITYPKRPGTGRTAQAPPSPPAAVTNTAGPATSVMPPGAGGSPALPPPVPPTAPPPEAPPGAPPAAPLTAESIQQQVDTTIPVEQFQAYIDEGFLDSNCPPNAPFKQDKAHIDRWFGGQGYQAGACVEKPTDQVGGNQAGGGGFGPGGRRGGPGGPGGPGGDYWTTDPAGWGMTDEEKAYLEAVGGLAKEMTAQSQKLFGAGFPAYLQATEYWKKLGGAYGRGGVDAALGPVREQISEGYQGAQAQLRGLRGAEKSQATADLARSEAGDLGRLPAELQPMAAAGLQRSGEFGVATGIAAEGQAAGLFLGAQQAEAQSRLTEEGLGVQQELGYLQAQTMRQVAALQATVNREQIAAQREMATATLAQRSYEFEQMYEQRNREFKLEMERWQQQYGQQRSDSRNRLIGGVAAAGVTIAIIL